MNSEIGAAFFLGVISFSILFWSWKKKIFSLETKRSSIPLLWFHPVLAFLIYLGIVTLLQPPLLSLFTKIVAPIPHIAIPCWLTFSVSVAILLGLILYCFFLPQEIRSKIWRDPNANSLILDIYSALLMCIIAFPLILFLGQFFDVLLHFVFHVKQLPDQVAVLFVKMTLGHPLYFSLMLVTVTLLAPCIEELLFRGFLQSFLRKHLGIKLSIFLSSLCFAFFHYSSEQGIANISIIGSLLVLSFFLGFIYEKRGALLSSIILHSSFNAFSVVNLYFLENFSKTNS